MVTETRKSVLQPLVDFIRQRAEKGQRINLNFICTHNSRRSHFAQIWAQVASAHYRIADVNCYSGGTEETAVHPMVVRTLENHGFKVFKITKEMNPVYAMKYSDNRFPIIGFSKKYNSPFNPVSEFAAIMTCSEADNGCPFIAGADSRIPVPYEDPELFDSTPKQEQVYAERSLQIAAEMFHVFSQIKK